MGDFESIRIDGAFGVSFLFNAQKARVKIPFRIIDEREIAYAGLVHIWI